MNRATRCRDKHLALIAARVLAGTMSPGLYSATVLWIYEATER